MIHHPASILSNEYIAIIRGEASKAEQLGRLTLPQLNLVYSQKWFKISVPAEYGGTETSLPQIIQLEEALSWADGSFGWVITLCSGAGWFGGFISPSVAPQIFIDEQLCVAGSGASTGTAEISGDGYTINGTWKYASGVHHATHITVNCVITQNNKTVLNALGQPLIQSFILDKKNVQLLPGWKYLGMVATGSDAYSINKVYVDKERCFKLEAGAAVIERPLYQYPFLQLAEATLAANLSGMAAHFLDLCTEIFKDKISGVNALPVQYATTLNNVLQNQTNRLTSARTIFYNALDTSWKDSANATLLKEVSQTSRKLAITAREVVDALYPYCGLRAAAPDTEINRVWRDLHTASQHSLLTFEEPPE